MRVKASIVALALVVTGCSYEPPGPAVEQAVAAPVDAARVTVEDAGSGDKRVLTFDDIDSEQDLKFVLTEGFAQDVVDANAPTDFESSAPEESTTSFDLNAEVSEASDDPEQTPATRNAFMTLSNPTYSGTDALNVESGDGFQFGWRADDAGQVSSLRLAAPQAANDDARSILEQAIVELTSMPIVFPDEEIGEGAIWTLDSRTSGDSTLLQTTTYTLDKLTETGAELSLDISQRPALGALSMEDGGELEVMDTETRSSGNLTIDFSQPLPTSGNIDIATRVTYGTQESEIRVLQSTNTRMQFSPAAQES
ncbi:MAG: hypothetical protein ACTIA3_00940 [Corynebacterium casei]|uniref:Uncharacterized protein n=2 Tax=Corynebacterium casei TaxID=160386 RepID=G7HV47_9CORY|nr:hypothetical protein [Corynebacterium casei]AHI19699.1 hypothetical protein CCASEI_05615 [Corynebacterium casei LMG S-19264]CCE54062.1 putative uncharacterized protein [Corynebacterium casei UCMA 3821]HCJ67850.1 hypothetical protein [Corynebacterium casei]